MTTLDDLYDKHDVPVVIVDNEGIIQYVNQKFLNVFEYQKDEIIEEHIVKIIPPDLRDAHNSGFSRYLSTGESTIMEKELELKAIKKGGEVFMATHYILSGKRDNKIQVGATILPLVQK